MDGEFKFQLIIVPEDYDYSEEEIVYRIYFENQLISERSLPFLQEGQAITDNFFLSLSNDIERKKCVELEKLTIYNSLFFVNVKNKKAFIKKIIVNTEIEIIKNYKNMEEGFFTAMTVNSVDIAFLFFSNSGYK